MKKRYDIFMRNWRLAFQQVIQLQQGLNETMSLTLSILEIVAPQGSDFVLTSYIPYCEGYVFVFYCFNVKS